MSTDGNVTIRKRNLTKNQDEVLLIEKMIELFSFFYDSYLAVSNLTVFFPNFKNFNLDFSFSTKCLECDEFYSYIDLDCINTTCETVILDTAHVNKRYCISEGSECFTECGYVSTTGFCIESHEIRSGSALPWNLLIIITLSLYSFGGLVTGWKDLLRDLAKMFLTFSVDMSTFIETMLTRNTRCSEAVIVLKFINTQDVWGCTLLMTSMIKSLDKMDLKRLSKILLCIDIFIVNSFKDKDLLLITLPVFCILVSLATHLYKESMKLGRDTEDLIRVIAEKGKFEVERQSRKYNFLKNYSLDFFLCEFVLIHLNMLIAYSFTGELRGLLRVVAFILLSIAIQSLLLFAREMSLKAKSSRIRNVDSVL
jgi:hypothetical protein